MTNSTGPDSSSGPFCFRRLYRKFRKFRPVRAIANVDRNDREQLCSLIVAMPKTKQVLVDHERYVRRLDGGCKAQFRFVNLPDMDLQRRQLKEIEFLGCNLRGSRMALSNFSYSSFYGLSLIHISEPTRPY